MNILCTGSRGFLGTQLCKRLRADGHKVIGWDLAHSAEPDEYRVDITKRSEIDFPNTVPALPNIIIHLAAEFGRCNGQLFYERMWQTATIGTRNIIWWAKECQAKLIFASSSEAYGTLADEHDVLSEDLLEHLAPKFHNEYSLSKWCGERQVRMHLTDYVIMRIFNVYGPTEPKHQYRSFISRLCSGQDVTIYDGLRSWLFIDDFVDAVCLLLGKTGVFNVGSPHVFANWKVAEMAERLDSNEPTIGCLAPEPSNVTRKVPNVSKLMALGWSPKVSLEQGIAECLKSR